MNNIKINKNSILNILFLLIFITGALLRLYFYITHSTFEEDECRLAIAILDAKNLFLPLLAAQTAPPFFTIATKVLTDIFGTSEYIYRLIPLISSFLSLFFFYKLCKKYLKNELAVFLGFLIFAISVPVIQYAFTFKQYSSDLLVGILCLLYLPQIKLKDLNIKHQVILTSVLCLLPFFSLTSVFFIGAFFILNINKKLLYTIIPFSVMMGLYYYFNLHQSSINMNNYCPDFWDKGFFNYNFNNFISLIGKHLKFLFNPNQYILSQLILLIIGLGLALKDKKFYMMLITMVLIFTASLLHIYPFLERTALYTASIFIILILNSFSTESKKIFITSIILFIIGFCNYTSLIPAYKQNLIQKDAPKVLMSIIKNNYNIQKDTIAINVASEPSFAYYAIVLGFNQYNFNFEIIDDSLEDLPKNKYYWLFLARDYYMKPVVQNALIWAKKQTILRYYKEKGSYLIYLKT